MQVHLCMQHCTSGNTALFEELLQQWRAIGNTLISPRFELQTSISRDERLYATFMYYIVQLCTRAYFKHALVSSYQNKH